MRWLLPFQEPPLSVAWLAPDNVPSVAETSTWPDCTLSKAPAPRLSRPDVPTGTPPNRDPVDSEGEPYLPVSAHRCAQPSGTTVTPRRREGPPTVWPTHMQLVPERLLTLHLDKALTRFRDYCLRRPHSRLPWTRACRLSPT
jgi:hypothetical protein